MSKPIGKNPVARSSAPLAQTDHAPKPVKLPATAVVPPVVDQMQTTPMKGVDESRQPAVTSTLHFLAHAGMPEIQSFGASRGWAAKGWSAVSVFAQDIVYTTDAWKTTQSLKSSSVPSPFVNGRILIPNVPKGTEVEFALHLRVAASDPHDIGGHRDRGDLWLNNGGQNYRQVTT